MALLIAVFQNRSSNLAGHAQPSLILASSSVSSSEPFLFRVGAAAAEMEADDSMVIGGSIEPVKLAGQEGKLRATAVVIAANTRLCLVACDVLMMNRDLLDEAARRIEKECAIPFDHILINASHTHHAPSTVTIHGYERDEVFSRRAVEAIVTAARQANDRVNSAEPSQLLFRLGQEATIGQNSRQLMKDGKIYWIGPRDDFVRPTGPFDSDLPVFAFRRSDGKLTALFFNHSTHCIGTRERKRSPGFYGLASQELGEELGVPVAFFSGASGSTHNLALSPDEMILRIKAAVREALSTAAPVSSVQLAGLKREFVYKVRQFDEKAEDRAVVEYCQKYAPQRAEAVIKVFRDSRNKLSQHQGELRKTWLQVMRIGEIYLVGVPAEFFTKLGIEIKRRSPHRYTFVFGLSNDYIGYVPDKEAFHLGGYQTWTGLHSIVPAGTGEAIVDEAVAMLNAVK